MYIVLVLDMSHATRAGTFVGGWRAVLPRVQSANSDFRDFHWKMQSSLHAD
jgi:hypothetical protein